jgi:hypothetical protein
MKALLILPATAPGVEALAESAPLGNFVLFGTSLAARWLEYLATLGAKQVRVLAPDRPEEIRAALGDGTRWGLELEIIAETAERSVAEARAKYHSGNPSQWLAAPHDIVLANCFPELPEAKLFHSYAGFFDTLQKALPIIAARGRVGLRQLRPGVWAGLRTHISEDAVLEGPCWLGAGVHIEKQAHIGPNAILEDSSWVGAGAEVRDSLITPETHLGVATSLNRSLALGNTLVDWQTNSAAKIADAFLLCSLRAAPLRGRLDRMAYRVANFIVPERRFIPAKSFTLDVTPLQ